MRCLKESYNDSEYDIMEMPYWKFEQSYVKRYVANEDDIDTLLGYADDTVYACTIMNPDEQLYNNFTRVCEDNGIDLFYVKVNERYMDYYELYGVDNGNGLRTIILLHEDYKNNVKTIDIIGDYGEVQMICDIL